MASVGVGTSVRVAARGAVGAPATPRDALIAALKVLALGGVFVWLFWDWFRAQNRFSVTMMEDWGHAYAVPLISFYLLWENRAAVLAAPRSTFWPGLAPLLLGVMCYFFFIVGVSNHMLQGWAMVLTLAGTTLLAGGPRLFRHAFLPIAFLLLGVKISDQVMLKVTFPLQLLASQGAELLLKIVSIGGWFSVVSNGNTLTIFHKGAAIPLNVAEACSGARMVIGFIVLAAAVALLGCRHWWQRIALLLLSAPVALLMNAVRVAVLGLASLIDPNLASGQAHMFIGMVLLVVALFLFLGVLWVLQKLTVDSPAGAKGAS